MPKTKKRYHKISNAYDAWWFLYEHPKYQRRHRTEVDPTKAEEMKAAGFFITTDRSGKVWREFRHSTVPAIVENLDVHYAKTDGRRVNKDNAKNINVECWLEFGSVEYGYMTGNSDPADWDTETHQQNYHDWKLDCGGPTFDAALVKLAKNVLKVYGDYRPRSRRDKCGRPCGDCRESSEWMKEQKLEGGRR